MARESEARGGHDRDDRGRAQGGREGRRGDARAGRDDRGGGRQERSGDRGRGESRGTGERAFDRGDRRGGDRRGGDGHGRGGARGRDQRAGKDESRAAAAERERLSRGAPRLSPKAPRKPEPAIREGVTGHEIDRGVKNQLRTLSKENAEGVAQHLVMVAELLDTDPEAALAHAETAVRRAGRVPAAREALGLVAYRMGDWARALSEFRTARRLSGSSHLLPLMVDCERGLGRPRKALELAQSDEARGLTYDERVELAIVVSGIRRDMGQRDAAVAGLSDLARQIGGHRTGAARLYYAYADALLADGDEGGAREWFAKAADADHELTTDAAERLDELDGVEVMDILGDDDEQIEVHHAKIDGTGGPNDAAVDGAVAADD